MNSKQHHAGTASRASIAARWLALATLGLAGCSSGPKPEWDSIRRYIDESYPALESLTPEQLEQRLEGPGPRPFLVDARQADEYEVSHIQGALLVESRHTLGERLREQLGAESTRPIVVYCSVGVRSASVAKQLLDEGFDPVFNLDGSLFEWANQGLPLVGAKGPTTKAHPYNASWGQLLKRELWSFGEQAD